MRNHRLDAALVATAPDTPEITGIPLFDEPLLAVLPLDHKLANAKRVHEAQLAKELLVLADGHCLANHALEACGAMNALGQGGLQRSGLSPGGFQRSMQAATLETLVNLAAAGYGSTLIPGLAADSFRRREIVLRPLAGRSSRTIRLASRPGFPRPHALRAIEKVLRKAVATKTLKSNQSWQA